MSCSCNNDTILASTAATAVSDTILLITPTVSLSPTNEQGIKILITSSTPSAGAILPVSIVLNGTNIPLLDKFGNLVYGNQIYKNMILKGYYGNNGVGNAAHYQLIRLPHRFYYWEKIWKFQIL